MKMVVPRLGWLSIGFILLELAGNSIRADDPHHIRFGPVPPLVDTDTEFGLTLRAERADGTLETSFQGNLTLVAEGLEGVLTVSPAQSGALMAGQLGLRLRVTAPGRVVRLRAAGFPGASEAFNVVQPPVYGIAQKVADIAWHEPSQTLMATVPAQAETYANCLVAIDPLTGLVTNAYPVASGPGRMEMSPGGSHCFLAVSNDAAMQRFDFATRTAGPPFVLGTNAEPVRFAYDFCVPAGLPDTVVVAAWDRTGFGNAWGMGIWKYTTGVPSALPVLSAGGGWQVESAIKNSEVLVFPPMVRGTIAIDAVLATASGYFGRSATVREDQVYDEYGNHFAVGSLSFLGNYPNVSDSPVGVNLVEVNPNLRRVFYLAEHPNGAPRCQLKIYDRDLHVPIVVLNAPSGYGSPTRLLRFGSHGLAYVTSLGQLWFVRPEAVQPTEPAANLGLSMVDIPPKAQVRTDYTFKLALTNAGPGLATLARVTNALPSDTTLVRTVASSGVVTPAAGGFAWTVAPLPAGSNATLEVTLRFLTAGAQTNRAWALPFEHDPSFVDNAAVLPLKVELPPSAPGVFVVQQPAADMIYDPIRDRLILSVAQGVGGKDNGLAIVNPNDGQVESFVALGSRPDRLVQSADRQYLYLSMPDDAVIRQFDRSTLQKKRQFDLGGESIYGEWYPFYAADLAVNPTDPEAVVAWRARRPGQWADAFGQGVAWLDRGVIRSNTTSIGGNWLVRFQAGRSNLFAFSLIATGGYDTRVLYRCDVTPEGVGLNPAPSPLRNTVGTQIKSTVDRFFLSGGLAVTTDSMKPAALFPGSENAVVVEPDDEAGRVWYLTMVGTDAVLRAHDINTTALLGSITVTNVAGVPLDLIRCGPSALGFRTSGGRLYLVRSPWVTRAADVDVALGFHLPATALGMNERVSGQLVVTNQGPSDATGLVVKTAVSSAGTLLSVTCDTGSCATNAGGISWSIPRLAPGGTQTLQFALAGSSPGCVTLTAGVESEQIDLALDDNTAFATLRVGDPAPDQLLVLPLGARDLAWSQSLGRLLFTASTNVPHGDGLLLSLDPITMELRREARLAPGAGRLCFSADGTRLFAAPTYGIDARRLPDFARQRRFLLGSEGAWETAEDMEAMPGLPDSLAVLRLREGGWSQVVVYDADTARTNVADCRGGGAQTMVLGPDSNRIFAQNFGYGGLHQYTMDASGVTFVDTDATLLPTVTTMDLLWSSGRIYSSVGAVIDPIAKRRLGAFPDVPAHAAICLDPASSRVFFIHGDGAGVTLRAFDGPSLQALGSARWSGTDGAVMRIVRWGSNGLAFITDGGQLGVVRSTLVPTEPPTDLAVGLAMVMGSPMTATCLITNLGPQVAHDIHWTNLLPAGVSIVEAVPTQGTATIQAGRVIGSIPSLEVGDVASVRVVFSNTVSGVLTNQFVAQGSAADPAFSNNRVVALLWNVGSVAAGSPWSLDLAVKDIEGDPVRPRIYVSCGASAGPLANSIVVVDPVRGTLSSPVRVGEDPGRLVVTPDGRFLHVALDGEGTVLKLALPDLVLVSWFTVPNHEVVAEMAVSPLDSDRVVVRHVPSARLCLHAGGVVSSNELPEIDVFAFSQASGELFGCRGYYSGVPLYRLDTGPDGLALLESQPAHQSQTTHLRASGPWMAYNRGLIFDADHARIQCTLSVPQDSIVTLDAAAGRAFFLTRAGTAWSLRAFDIRQGIEVGSAALSNLRGTPQRLVRWGQSGLAVATTSQQVLLFNDQFLPAQPPADVSMFQTVSSTVAAPNVPLSFSLAVSNAGPASAFGVVVTQSFSRALGGVSFPLPDSPAQFTNGAVVWKVGTLAAGSTASLDVTVQVASAGALTVMARASHAQDDVFWGDNVALQSITISTNATPDTLQWRLPVRDLAYDATRDVLYASTPASLGAFGNIVAVLDPGSGALRHALPAGSEPGRLAVSGDGKFLHVGVNGSMGVRRIDLANSRTDLEFSLGAEDMYFAQDLVAQPGRPRSVAVSLGSYNYATGWPSDVFRYEDGARLPVKWKSASGLVFSDDGSCLFGKLVQGADDYVRLWTGPAGFTVGEVANGFVRAPGELKFANGRLYSSTGEVIDPYADISLGSFPASGLLTVDASIGRALMLLKTGTQWELRAYDPGNFQLRGTQLVAGVEGTPTNLIRCGAGRVAFRTSSNQLFVVSSSLVSTNPVPGADLVVNQEAWQDFESDLNPLRFAITVTNRGPATANDVKLAVKLPSARTGMTGTLTQGDFSEVGGNLVGRLGTIAAGQTVRALVSVTIPTTDIYTNLASATALEPDPNPADNVLSVALAGRVFQSRGTTVVRADEPAGIAYDAAGRRLFVLQRPQGAVGRLLWLDPETSSTLGSLSLPVAADRFLITEDGSFLYLVESAAGRILRLRMPDLSEDLRFETPGGAPVYSCAVVPGRPRALAVTFGPFPDCSGALCYDADIRPARVPGLPFANLAASEDGAWLFGHLTTSTGGNSPDIYRMTIGSDGLHLVDNGPSDIPWGSGSEIRPKAGQLYFEDGSLMKTSDWSSEQVFVLPERGRSFAFIPGTDSLAFLAQNYSSYPRLVLASLTDRRLISDTVFNFGTADYRQLTWCGADHLAFCSAENLVLVRAAGLPVADVSTRVLASTNRLTVTVPVTLSLLVSNAGPSNLSSTRLTNTLPIGLSLLSFTNHQGPARLEGRNLIADIAALPVGAVAKVELVCSATGAPAGWITNQAVVVGDLPDPVVFNNQALRALYVECVDDDRDGIPNDWEVAHGLDPVSALDAASDQDGDGLTAWQEYRAGTDPRVPEVPLNDLFANASLIEPAVTSLHVIASAAGAQAESGEPAHGTLLAAARSVWWRWKPLYRGQVVVTLSGRGAAAAMSVYTGNNSSNLVRVASSDPTQPGVLTFTAQSGVNYALAFDPGPEGDATLDWTLQWQNTKPGNDAWASAEVLPSEPLAFSFVGMNGAATAEPGEPAHAGEAAARSLWWAWTPRVTCMATLTVKNEGEGVLRTAVYVGNELNRLQPVGACLGFAKDPANRVVFPAHAGERYWIAVDGNFSDAAGAFVATVVGSTLFIDNPPTGSKLALGVSSVLAVSNTDEDFRPRKVDLFLDGVSLGSLGASPYRWAWPASQGGWHVLQARAINHGGEERWSLAQDVLVSPANDDWARAAELPDSGTSWVVNGDTAYASWETGEPDARPYSHQGSVWYRFRPSATREFSLGFKAPPGTWVQAFSGASLTQLTPVTGPFEGNAKFSALFDATQRQFIRVSKFETNAGPTAFQLELFAPPANDDLAHAITLPTASGLIIATNLSATLEAQEPFIELYGSMWWRWTAPEEGMLQVWAEESECAIVAAVYVGSDFTDLRSIAGPVRVLAHSPWAAAPLTCRVRKGRSYLIELGADSRVGPRAGMLRAVYEFTAIPDAAPNDDFFDRIPLTGTSVTATGRSVDATREWAEPEDTGTRTLWWEWTAAQDGVARIWGEGEGGPPIVMIYRGTSLEHLVEVFPRFDRLNLIGLSGPFSFPVRAGETFAVSAGMPSYVGNPGQTTLRIENETLDPAASNDGFARAWAWPEHSFELPVSLASASYETNEPNHAFNVANLPTYSGSLWWRLQPTRSAHLVIRATGPAGRPVVAAYRGGSLTTLEKLMVGLETITLEVAPGTTYYFALVGPSLFNSSYQLRATYLPMVAANDAFSQAVTLSGTHVVLNGALYGCTRESGEPTHGNGMLTTDGRSAWWSWVAPAAGRGNLSYDASQLALGLYTGSSVDRLAKVELSGSSFFARKDTQYYVAVEGVQGGGDLIAAAIDLEPYPAVPRNDHFANAVELVGPSGGTTESILGATREAGEPEHRPGGPNKSLWWRWTAPHHATAFLRSDYGLLRDITLAVYSGTTLETLQLVARGVDVLSFSARGGTTYLIAAETAAEREGDVGVYVNLRPPDGTRMAVPGNLVLNPSFEELELGWPSAHWVREGNISGVVSQDRNEGAADGGNFLVLGAGQVTQDINTSPGQTYRVKLGIAGTEYAGSARVLVRFGPSPAGEFQFEASMTELYWHWPEFVFTAAGALTRLEIESTGALIQLDQVSVVAIRQPPHFSSGPESHTAFSGATVSFRVDVEGDEPLALQWFCNGEPIVGERQPSLVLTHVDRSRAGTYQCRAANPYGTNLSRVATLAILAPTSPIFLLHPQDANPTAGSYLSLSAVALGTPPLSMQWFKDGLALVGETNRSLIIAKFEPTQAGLYHVVVSNALESVRSLQAHVVEAPVTPDVGVLRFTNQRLPVGGVPDAPIYDTDGITPLQGAGFLAQLYVSSESEPLRPAGQPRPFLTGYMQGMISADVVFLPGVPASVGVRAQIRVWQAADGLSYEEARAVGGKTGESEILSVTTGPSNPPSPSLGLLVGLSSFNLHAGLPEFHGGLLELVSTGLDGTLTWSLFGQPGARYLVERRIDGAHWLPLVTLENVTGRVTFSDRPEPSRSVVLYRAQWLP